MADIVDALTAQAKRVRDRIHEADIAIDELIRMADEHADQRDEYQSQLRRLQSVKAEL